MLPAGLGDSRQSTSAASTSPSLPHHMLPSGKHDSYGGICCTMLMLLGTVFACTQPKCIYSLGVTGGVMTSSPGDGKALKGQQTRAQPLGWLLSHQVCWVVSEMVQGYHS